MADGHDPPSGLLDDESGSAEELQPDPLSVVLRAVRLTGTCFFGMEASASWWAEVPNAAAIGSCILPDAQQLVSYHIVTEGRCWAGLDDGTELWADAGDIIVIPHGDCYALANAPGVVGEQPLEVSQEFFRQLTTGLLPPTIRYGREGAADLRMLCGFLGCDLLPFNPILGMLPRLVRVSATNGPRSRRLARLVEFAQAEARERLTGSDVVLLRISELLFVEVVRRYVDTLPPQASGWLAGLRDPIVSRALMLLHRQPARAWSLDALARDAAVSRSVLAERFTRLIGQAPIHYLTRWRMQLASQRLLEGTTVGRVGLEVGYESEAAFSRAFKKIFGSSPATWRRGRQP